ncbi:MAG: histidinol dehydrogenase, partial [Nitrososphaera sp.]
MKIVNATDATDAARALRKSASVAISDQLMAQARAIMEDVRVHGDDALLNYTEKFDGVRLASVRVSEQEVREAYNKVSKEQVRAIKLMKARLEKGERAVMNRLRNNITIRSEGVRIERVVQPVASVGCYIPGGKARYPSTVVMCAVPAKAAGVRR